MHYHVSRHHCLRRLLLHVCLDSSLPASPQSPPSVSAPAFEERGGEADAQEVRAHRQVPPLQAPAVPLRRLHVQGKNQRDPRKRQPSGKIITELSFLSRLEPAISSFFYCFRPPLWYSREI